MDQSKPTQDIEQPPTQDNDQPNKSNTEHVDPTEDAANEVAETNEQPEHDQKGKGGLPELMDSSEAPHETEPDDESKQRADQIDDGGNRAVPLAVHGGVNKTLLRRLHPAFSAIHLGNKIPAQDLKWVNCHFPWGSKRPKTITNTKPRLERCVPAYFRPLYLMTLGLVDDFDSAHEECLQFLHHRFYGSPEGMKVQHSLGCRFRCAVMFAKLTCCFLCCYADDRNGKYSPEVLPFRPQL
jgi:hypothetical protein